jgi:hypothetical protein
LEKFATSCGKIVAEYKTTIWPPCEKIFLSAWLGGGDEQITKAKYTKFGTDTHHNVPTN